MCYGSVMTASVVAYSDSLDPGVAASEISARIAEEIDGPPDALILFASPKHDQPKLIAEIQTRCKPGVLVGASSAGEFTSDQRGEGLACALALKSTEIRFAAGIGRGISGDRAQAARDIISGFRGIDDGRSIYRSALVLTDALAGHADDLVEQLTLATAAGYQFFGGGAGDDAQFRRTRVFYGTEAVSDAAVALEILSEKPLGVGVGHGWEPISAGMRVTEVRGSTLVSLNGLPAFEAFERHAATTRQALDRNAPLSFFLHNIIGIASPDGHRLRVPLAVGADGSVDCAAEIPQGSVVHIMRTSTQSAVDAAARATKAAVAAIGGHKPRVALFFDCVATRLRMGDAFGFELESLAKKLGPDAKFIGCNTHGQIARAEGQFGGFHNCTAVVCVFPE